MSVLSCPVPIPMRVSVVYLINPPRSPVNPRYSRSAPGPSQSPLRRNPNLRERRPAQTHTDHTYIASIVKKGKPRQQQQPRTTHTMFNFSVLFFQFACTPTTCHVDSPASLCHQPANCHRKKMTPPPVEDARVIIYTQHNFFFPYCPFPFPVPFPPSPNSQIPKFQPPKPHAVVVMLPS